MSQRDLDRRVIDTNYLEKPELARWLGARKTNIAVIAHPTMIELHRRDALRTIQQALRICCQYSRQVVILRSTDQLIALTGRGKGLVNRLVSPDETRQFGAYCRTVIEVAPTSEIVDHVAPLEVQARELRDALARSAANLIVRLKQADDILTAGERRELRGMVSNRRPMSGPLQRKTCAMAFDLAQELTQAAGLAPLVATADRNDIVNRLAFRYGAMIVGYYVVAKDHDGRWISNPDKQLRQVFDLKIASLASYFDGLMTAEGDLAASYRIGRSLIAALGGYVRCGRG
ncbi:hypothetical protein [Sphingomonas sp.]|uniref:hypothetical protein n=1 Tax=Sphingomonas sp. TaxID=28214 RepID=UPI0025F3670A|nr:hypothetical protein [Sphingomonas sp.]